MLPVQYGRRRATASFAITSIIPKFNHHRHDTVTPICDFALALIARQLRDDLRDVVNPFAFVLDYFHRSLSPARSMTSVLTRYESTKQMRDKSRRRDLHSRDLQAAKCKLTSSSPARDPIAVCCSSYSRVHREKCHGEGITAKVTIFATFMLRRTFRDLFESQILTRNAKQRNGNKR